MSYEYSSNTQTITFPNPLRIHNYFIGGAAAITGITGFWLLFQARAAMRETGHLRAIGAAVVAFLLLVIAGRFLYQLMTQLRFSSGAAGPAGSPGNCGMTSRAPARSPKTI